MKSLLVSAVLGVLTAGGLPASGQEIPATPNVPRKAVDNAARPATAEEAVNDAEDAVGDAKRRVGDTQDAAGKIRSRQSRTDLPEAAANAAERHRDQMQRAGNGRAILGVRAAPSPTIGVRIEAIDMLGPAGTAGLLADDYILEVDGEEVSSPRELAGRIDGMTPGDRATLLIWRNGERRTLNVTLGGDRTANFRRDRDGERRGDQPADSKAWLGVLVNSTDDGQGIRIDRILPDSPADKAGLRRGDILKQFDGQPIRSVGAFIRSVDAASPQQEVTLQVHRDGQEMQKKVMLEQAARFDVESGYGEFRGPADDSQEPWTDFPAEELPASHEFLLEQHRHLAEQNQRLEKMLIDIHQQLQELQSEMSARSSK